MGHVTKYGLLRRFCLLIIMISVPGTSFAETSVSASLKSKYIWGGVLMGDGAVVQSDLKYTSENGLFIGGMFSTLDFSNSGNNQLDVKAGYSGSVGGLEYEAGFVRHSFTGDAPTDEDAGVLRTFFSGSIGSFNFILKIPLNDASWTSTGDIYTNIGLVKTFPADFHVSIRAAAYYFADDAVFDNGMVAFEKKQSFAFRNATLAIEHAVTGMPLDLGLHYSIGGERRNGIELDDHVWISLNMHLP
ncbi:TorF family putative porin [Methylophaga sp.]|uniref:TorF family putative porin n=1 Tax=Methylophaga sp. TaxID=2024840 RepID=UPI003A92C4CC